MNKTLAALIHKLSWQREEVNQLFQEHSTKLHSLQQNIERVDEKIQQAAKIPALISPEKEISRLHFIIHSQQEREQLITEKKALESCLSQLKERKLRIYTEIKMLKRYQFKQNEREKKQHLELLQKEQDAWVLQGREGNEN